jgi:hypothetical protein
VPYKLRFSPAAAEVLKDLANRGPNDLAKLKKINRALGRLEQNPRHPGLNSYRYENFPGVSHNVKVWHSYVENNTPSAWRIWYGVTDRRRRPGDHHGLGHRATRLTRNRLFSRPSRAEVFDFHRRVPGSGR